MDDYKTPTEMYAGVGRMVADWNSLESDLIEMIGQISRARPTTDLLTAHMTSQAICNALKALALTRLPAEMAEHVVHAVDFFERLRTYRNQFVHGITAVISDGPKAMAMTHGRRVSPNGHFEIDRGWLHRSELDTMTEACGSLSSYLNYLRVHIGWHIDPEAEPPRAFRHWPPEKPAVPPKLPARWEPHPL